MYTYLLLLRFIHIVCGIFWAGTALFLAFYIFPAVAKAGPDGGKMMQAISGTRKFPTVMTVASLLTLLSGLLLMWELSAGFKLSWFSSAYAITLLLGSLTALIAFVQGLVINRPGILRMQEIGKRIAQRGAPTSEESGELGKLRARIFLSTQWIAVWILISVVAMGIARYI
jgi:uncharacterized membrane protein